MRDLSIPVQILQSPTARNAFLVSSSPISHEKSGYGTGS